MIVHVGYGRVVLERVASEALNGNAAGDTSIRSVPIYLPRSYDNEPARRFPVAYVLAGFTGRGRMLLNDDPWSPPIDRRMDSLVMGNRCDEMILVLPDCFTRYGGSQYLDSTATGRYEEHLVSELVPLVDERYRTLAAPRHRGIMGKSSGGYGALVQAMKHPDVFGAVASHSGDLYFDYCYRADVPKLCSALQRAGGVEPWLKEFESREKKRPEDVEVLNMIAMAAAYSPNPAAPLGIDLPCDLETSAFREDVWERWRAHDPLEMLASRADALRSMRLVFLDCGTRDEWNLHHGARLFARRLRELSIRHEHQEYEDGHRNVSYRYDVSLPKMAAALAPPA